MGYRQMLFTAPQLSSYVSGVILHEETIGQRMKGPNGEKTCPELLKDYGIIPGIKVDKGFAPMMGAGKETHTQGLDDLGARCKKFYEMGARFAKWRSPIHIGAGMPSDMALAIECHGLARYASICQENGLVPIVEPDVVMDGDHSIEVSALVTKRVLQATFTALDQHHVDIEGMIIKTNMVRPGADSASDLKESPELTAAATVKVFAACIPPALPGVVFLSGGMSEVFATAALAAINAHPDRQRIPYPLTFSYGRALQHSARVAWLGKAENYEKAQLALCNRAKMNSEASLGKYDGEDGSGAAGYSLHVAGGNKY